MSINRYFKLYLNAGIAVAPVIHVNQYDQGESWYFALYKDNGEAYIPADGSIIGVKSDGNIITNAGTITQNYVVITETQQMTAAAGKAIFELQIDGGTHGTANFIVQVEPSPTDGGVVSDSDLSLIEEALNSVTPAVIAEEVTDWMDENITQPTNPVVDASLTVSGAAADAKATGDAIAAVSGGSGLTSEIKEALLALFQHVAWKDTDADDAYDALEEALYPPANLVSISAVYTQSGVVYTTTPLDNLKTDLVVTAHYDDLTTETVTTYTLSGTLTEGTSTITVTYGGKTTTFTVTVTSSTVVIQGSSLVIGANQNYYRGMGYGDYIDTGTKTRLCYSYFDILTEANTTYQVTVDWNTTYDLYASANIYDENVLTEVANHESITKVDDTGWIHLSEASGVFTISSTYDSAMRFYFKIANAGSTQFTVGNTYVNSISISAQ